MNDTRRMLEDKTKNTLYFTLKDVDLEKEMDDALHFVAKNIKDSGHNAKPVLLHSFKMAYYLYLNNYSKDIIISAILHDLIEDTKVTGTIIEKEYNSKIKTVVEAVSFNPDIEDQEEQYISMFNECIKMGFEALIVKCVDLLDNINYVHLVKNKEFKKDLLKKYDTFLNMTKKYIGNEIVYKELKKRLTSYMR